MNSKESNSGIIQEWVRPLQKSLTFEIEAQFINILGKERFFNEYVFEQLKKNNHLNLSEEIQEELENFSNQYKNYINLEIGQRKMLVLDTRNFLLRIINLYDSKSKKNNSIIKKGVYSLYSDVGDVSGVGKILKKNLNQIGIFIIKDIINHFPRTYLDYSNKAKIINLRPENLYTCTGNIKKFYIYKSKNNTNLSIMSIVIFDESSSIKITKFFHGKRFRSFSFFQSQKDKFKPGIKLVVSGKVKKTDYGRSFVDPQIEILNSNDDNIYFSGKILPVYTLNEHISNINFIKIVRKILPCINHYPDILDIDQLKSLSLFSLKDSLINIHFPRSQSSLNEAKRRLLFDELLLLQLKFLQKRKNRELIVYRNKINEKEKSLLTDYLLKIPFELTLSQKKVLEEIKLDIANPSPMSRLLQGDVGSGKTIIAIASLLIIVERGFQGALMVPTEVLATQHYKNLVKYLDPLDVSVQLLTGNTTQKNRKKLLTDLANGQINILVGTHALFEEKVVFNSLGLVVIDEQHRFGVSQRNRLLQKGEDANLLSMTATPIPRTLALSLYGDLDVSQITELPPGRIPVNTTVVSQDDLTKLFKTIEKEIYKGRQAYVILHLIEDS